MSAKNQSNAQSDDQISVESLLNILPVELFYEICAYLYLEEKVCRFPALSRSIKKLFDPSKCCIDHLSIKVMDGFDASPELRAAVERRRLGRMLYLQYASDVCVSVDVPLADRRRQNIVMSLRKSLLSGHMKALSTRENSATKGKPSITLEIMNDLHHSTVRLHSLDIFTRDSTFCRGNYQSIKQCMTLKSVRFACMASPPNDDHSFFVDHLPESVNELIIQTFLSPEQCDVMWNTKFRSAEFLPNLKRFALMDSGTHEHFSAGLSSLLATTMKQTRTLRPIELWHCARLTKLKELNRFAIKDLNYNVLDKKATDQMFDASASLLPHLERICMKGSLQVDPAPAIHLAAKRSVKRFVLAAPPSHLISDSAVKKFAVMKDLIYLDLQIGSAKLFSGTNFQSLIPANSWSNLTCLRLQWNGMSEEQLAPMFAASPNLREILLRSFSTSVSNIMVLAMLCHFCPLIARVSLMAMGQQDRLNDTKQAFTRYPVPRQGLQNLLSISATQLTSTGPSAHMLLRQLARAPRLAYLDLSACDSAPYILYMTRMVPSLRSVLQLSDDQGNPSNMIMSLQSRQLVNLIEFPLTLVHHEGLEFYRYQDIDGHITDYGTSFDNIMTSRFGDDCFYPCFKRTVDEDGVTGRDQFYNHLYSLLSDKQKGWIAAWNTGDYSVGPSQK